MIYYCFRHGESEANKARLFASKKINPVLTEAGREQAVSMGSVMRNISVEKIFVSPLKRAQETARLIFPKRELITLEDLRETNVGDLDGISEDAPANWSAYMRVVNAWEKGQNYVRFSNGESNTEIKARIVKVLEQVNSECKDSAALVAHSDILRSFFWLFCKNRYKNIQDHYMNRGRLTVVKKEGGIYNIEKFNVETL